MKLISKYTAYKVVNPLANKIFSHKAVSDRTTRAMQANNIRFVEIGGAVAVDQYLVIHLSPVEIYGIPKKNTTGLRYNYDVASGSFSRTSVSLKSSLTLHYNLLNGIPVASDTVEGINMSHFLEHFTREEGLLILKECHRILKPGGALRISCPDLKKFATAYLDRDHKFFEKDLIKRFINYENLTTPGDLFIQKAYDGSNGHKWFYDAESALQLAYDAGFTKGQEKQLHESTLPEIETIEPAYREIESFYVEAIK